MNNNDQKNKKQTKSVLDYDPLAWLSEGDSDEQDASEDHSSSVAKKSSVKNVTARKKTTKKKAARNKTVKKSVTQKVLAEKVAVEINESTNVSDDMSNANEENQGYGFFDDITDTAEHTVVKTEQDMNQQTETFGFFSDDDDQSDIAAKVDQGFGFFDSSDQLSSQAVKFESSTNTINLGADLTIRSVLACKKMIDENLSNGFDIKLAAGDLQKIDTAGLQLLYCLHRTLEKTSQSINWVSSNPIINDTAQLLGMPKLLESSDDEGSFGFF